MKSKQFFLIVLNISEANSFDDLLNLRHGLLHVLDLGGGDERVEGLVLARKRVSVLPEHLAFLHRSLAPYHDLAVALQKYLWVSTDFKRCGTIDY